MSYDLVFTLVNGLALAAWIFLALFPYSPLTSKLILGIAVALLCVTYAVLVYRLLQPTDFLKFGTLDGIAALLSQPGAALAGWIHYLAFDLMTGLFIANNASKHGIAYGWLLPCLLLTFMLGPIGLLLYLLLRWAITRYYFATNF